MRMRLLIASLAPLCVINANAMTDITQDIQQFAEAPIKYFESHQNNYEWIDKNTLEALCQLPPLKDVEDKFREWEKSKQPKEQINLDEVRANVKAFYKQLFGDSELEQYLFNVASEAIDRAELTWSSNVMGGESNTAPALKSIDDAPPYLRIKPMQETHTKYLKEITTNKKLSNDEINDFIEQYARKQFPEYDDWNIHVKSSSRSADNTVIYEADVEFNNSQIRRKVYAKQPDFDEVESDEKDYRVLYEGEDVPGAIVEELTKVLYLLTMEEDEYNNRFKYTNPDDQKKYDEWFEKIANRIKDTSKVAENLIAKVMFVSQMDAEASLVHEVAHIVDFAYILKTGNKKKNRNIESVSVYIEALYGNMNIKMLRLWELYDSVYSIVKADLLRRRFKYIFGQNEEDGVMYDKKISDKIQREYTRINDVIYKDHEYPNAIQLEKNVVGRIANTMPSQTEKEFLIEQFTELSKHVQALNNAVEMQNGNFSITRALEKLKNEAIAEITPTSFSETMKYLLK